MSESDEQPGLLVETYRSVGPRFRSRPDSEMNAIGWSIFLGMIVLLLPLLPFIVVMWALTRLFDRFTSRSTEDETA